MMIGVVKGNVVSSTKAVCLTGYKLLLVQPLEIESMKEKGDPVIALDGVGAGEGEVVMCVGGSSSRNCPEMKGAPSDLAILAIIDTLDVKGKRTYSKYEGDMV